MRANLPPKVAQLQKRMDEPSNRNDLDHDCFRCGGNMFFVGYKYHNATFATMLGTDEDGEPIYGDRTAPAPYAYWMCALGHQETDGY